jgi:hypothetical protein
VWTFHTQLVGTLSGTIPGGGSGEMTVFGMLGQTGYDTYKQTVFNWFTAPVTVPSGHSFGHGELRGRPQQVLRDGRRLRVSTVRCIFP